MTGATGYVMDVMSRRDVDRAIEWAAAEDWNPGLDDAAAFHIADPGGFFIGRLDGTPISAISVVSYDPTFAFLGLYIVTPEHRGRGLGLALWAEALRRRKATTIGLDGVVAQQANYARSGFRLAYRNIRFRGTLPNNAAPSAHIVDAATVPFDALAAYDRRCFPAPRTGFLAHWLAPRHGAARAWIESGTVRGYGVIRACREGWKIGPLFADDAGIAEGLALSLAAAAGGNGPLHLDVPEPHPAGLRLVETFGFAPVFETARMYAGPAPETALDKIFGVTTFELG